MLSILHFQHVYSDASTSSFSIWSSLEILGLGANFLYCATVSLYACDGLSLTLEILDLDYSDMDTFYSTQWIFFTNFNNRQ